MNYHGACLSKVLFLFEDPKILVKSLLSLSEEVLFLTRHEYGSFVVEEFIASQSVSKSYKRKFLLMVKVNLLNTTYCGTRPAWENSWKFTIGWTCEILTSHTFLFKVMNLR